MQQQKDSLQGTEVEDVAPIRLHEVDWNLHRTGVRLYSFRLVAGDVALLLSPRGYTSGFPSARLEIGSLTSQTVPLNILHDVRHFLGQCGARIVKEQLSEVHFAADFIGLAIDLLNLDDRHRWVARSRHFTPHYENWELTGCSLGKGDIMLRCYDKVRELRRAEHKQEVFAALWELENYDAKPVTRIEFQLRRPVLRHFSNANIPRGVTTFDDLLDAASAIWQYCTSAWARLSAAPVDRANRNQGRVEVAVFWQEVQAIRWSGLQQIRRYVQQKHKNLDSLRKQVRGGMMSVLSFYVENAHDFDRINSLAQQVIADDLRAFQDTDGEEFIKRMRKRRNEAVLDTVPF